MSDEFGVLEAMHTMRAIRRFRPDPVPDDVLAKILGAATMAPSGGNAQPWQFLVVRDAEVKRRVGAVYDEIYDGLYGRESHSILGERTPMGEAPVLVMVCRRTLNPPVATSVPSLYASIYPAAQNLMLAARSLGVGSVLTTIHLRREAEFKAILGIPDDVEPCALIPLGYPKGNFGPLPRRSWQSVTFVDRWGASAEM